MAETKEPKVVEKIMIDKDGKAVEDPKDAVQVELTIEYPDGTQETTIMLKKSS